MQKTNKLEDKELLVGDNDSQTGERRLAAKAMMTCGQLGDKEL